MGLWVAEIWDLDPLADACGEEARHEFFLSAQSLVVSRAVGNPSGPVGKGYRARAGDQQALGRRRRAEVRPEQRERLPNAQRSPVNIHVWCAVQTHLVMLETRGTQQARDLGARCTTDRAGPSTMLVYTDRHNAQMPVSGSSPA